MCLVRCRNCLPREHLGSPPIFGGFVFIIFVIFCVVFFLFVFVLSYVSNVASVSGLCILYCPVGFLWRLFNIIHQMHSRCNVLTYAIDNKNHSCKHIRDQSDMVGFFLPVKRCWVNLTSNPWLLVCDTPGTSNLSQTNIKYLVISSVISDLFQANFEYLSTGKWCSLSQTNIESLANGMWYHRGLVTYLRPTSNRWLVWCDTPWASDIS